jgi:hypothetical protein
MYDSEDKRLIPFGNVNGDTNVTVGADFSMSVEMDGEGKPIAIKGFGFRNSDFVFVELHPYSPYDH